MTSEDRAVLSAADRDALPDSAFAYIAGNGDRQLPVHDEAHVRAALSRFSATQFDSDEDKPAAAKKILAAAKNYDIEVDPESPVGQAAGLKSDGSRKRFRNRTLAERRSALHRGYQRRTFSFEPAKATGEPGLELRTARTAATDGDIIPLVGYAIRYGTPYDVHDRFGTFSEEMRSGACKDTLASPTDDPVFLYDHAGLALGRRSAGTLRLSEDDKGLPIEVDLSAKQQIARDLAIAIERGDVHQMSVGFSVPDGGDTWNSTGTVRKVNKLTLYDVSAVGQPASPTTSIGLAGIDEQDTVTRALMADHERRIEERQLSYGNLQTALQAAVDQGDDWAYVCDFDDTTATYSSGGDTYQVAYSVDDEGNVTLSGDPVLVRAVTTYVPVPESASERSSEDASEIRKQRQLVDIRRRRLLR